MAMPPLAGFSTLVPSIHGLLEKSTHLASLSSWLFTGELYEYPALWCSIEMRAGYVPQTKFQSFTVDRPLFGRP